MKRIIIFITASFFVLVTSLVLAGNLIFPKTESEIVDALSLKDGETVYNGEKYIAERGKVYLIIKDKRILKRGLEDIVDSDITPKAGALIHFDFDSYKIKASSYPLLDEFGKALKYRLADAEIFIAGHTDSIGTEEYNQWLSEKRAQSVKSYLLTYHGIFSERLTCEGYGEIRPIASNVSKEERALNRRVEFIRIGGF